METEVRKTNWQETTAVLVDWFRNNARILAWRDDPTPYHVWISEIMLQQTRVEAVKSYYDRFLTYLPDIKSLAEADEELLLKLWEGLGYYSRVRNLQKAARVVMEEYGGELPADYGLLKTLPGIGDYTAGAIASIAFGIPVPAVDGNVLRVISRITESYEDILKQKTKKDMTALLFGVMPRKNPGIFNQALMELGAMVCIPNGAPLCDVCPLYGACHARKDGVTDKIPVKTPKKARRTENRYVLVVRMPVRESRPDGNPLDEGTSYRVLYRYAIRKREDKGLLAGLWEWPNAEKDGTFEQVRHMLAAAGIMHYQLIDTKKGTHIFSHIEWYMEGILIEAESCPESGENDWLFVTKDELEASYALPSAFEAFGEWIK